MHQLTVLITNLLSFGLGFMIASRFLYGNAVKQVSKDKQRQMFPVCIAEYMEGNYYLYTEKPQTFLCQAPTIEELAKTLKNNKHISLAFVVSKDVKTEMFWFADGEATPTSPNSMLPKINN